MKVYHLCTACVYMLCWTATEIPLILSIDNIVSAHLTITEEIFFENVIRKVIDEIHM